MADERINVREFLEKEAELQALRRQYGSEKEPTALEKLIDWFMNRAREPRRLSRKKYVALALSCGWFCGAHRFYSGHKIQGVLYLLFCWTGAPLALTLVDVMLVFLKHVPDEEGMIEL